MRNKQIKNITLSAITAAIIAGCGSDGINEVYQLTDDKADYTVQVVDDAVVGASVSAAECSGYIELDEGYYTLTGCTSRPKAIMADGGYVKLDDVNVTMGFPLILNTNMVNVKDLDHYTATPLTTLLASVDSYEELENMKNALGFDSIQDMFKDDNETRDIQQTLNTYFMEAQENGIDINNFFDFTDDFRSMIKEAHDSNATSNPIAAIKNGREKLKDDYLENQSKYLEKYGVVFSGFVTSRDYKSDDGAEELLKKIGQKLNVDEGSLIFSGFVYDSFIKDANITMKNLSNNSSYLDLNSSGNHTTWVIADEFGKYRLDLNKSQIIPSNTYLIEATKVKENNQTVVLNSLLTGTEILSKFKAKLNTSDIKDVTITNVTTAKTAFLEDANVLDANVSTIIAKKKEIEKSEQLIKAAAAIKQVVDYNGSMGDSNDTFEFAKKIIDDQSVTLKDTNVTSTQVNTLVKEIEKDKTLNDQLTSTTYVAPTLQESDIQDKVINFKKDNNINTTDLYLFSDNTYRLKGKDIKNNVSQDVGTWEIVYGKLQLNPSDSDDNITVTLPELTTQSAPTVSNGKVTISATKRGSYGSSFFTINNVNKIDYTKETPPFIKFTENNIKNKTFYKLTLNSSSEYEVTDMVYGTSWNAETNGSLTVDGINFDITKSYPNRLETSNGTLYFNQIDAEANSYIKAYDNNTTKVSISDNVFAVKAEVASSIDYRKVIESQPFYLNDKVAIGAIADMALTQNRGDSYRQTGTMNLSYLIPSCNEENDPGKLQVKVMIQQGRVAYKLTLVKSNGTEKDLSSAITIVEENTYKKSYEIISLIKDNKLAIRVTDGLNEYYKYRELKELWGNNTDLTYYKFPTQIGSTTFSAVLDDDGMGELYKGKANTPVELTVYNAYKINGNDSENNYEGGHCTVCNTGATTVQAPVSSTLSLFDRSWEEEDKDYRYTVSGNQVSIINDSSVILTTQKLDNNESRTEIVTALDTPVEKVSATINLSQTSTTYNMAQFRATTDISVTDSFLNTIVDENNNSILETNNLSATFVVGLTGKEVFGYLKLEDQNGNETGVSLGNLYYNDSFSDIVGKDVTVSVEKSDDTFIINATADGLTTAPIYFNPNVFVENTLGISNAITSTSNIRKVKIRTQIDDDHANNNSEEAGTTVIAIVKDFSTSASTSSVKVATIADAKIMVGTLRGINESMYMENNVTHEESGLIVHQDNLHIDKIDSVVEKIDSDLNTTIENISNLADNFVDKVDSDLNSTIEDISSRLDAISAYIDSAESNGTTDMSIDGLNFAVEYATLDDNETYISKVTATNQSLSGTDYNLSISNLTVNVAESTEDTNGSASIDLIATADISAGDTTFNGTLSVDGNLSLPSYDDELIASDLRSLNFNFDGRVISDSRVLDGNLSIFADGDISAKLHGKLTGKAGEPTVEGELTASANQLDLDKTLIRGEEVYWSYVNGDIKSDGPILYNHNGTYLWVITNNGDDTYTVSNGTTTLSDVSVDSENLVYGKNSAIKMAFMDTDTNGSDISEITYIGSYDTYGADYDANGNPTSFDVNIYPQMEGYIKINTNNPTVAVYSMWDQDGNSHESNVTATVLSVEQREKDEAPQSYSFKGSAVDGDVSATLEAYYNKPLFDATKEEYIVQNLSISTADATLSADEIRYAQELKLKSMTKDVNSTLYSIDEDYEKSFNISNLTGTISDTNGSDLTVSINGSAHATTNYIEEGNEDYGSTWDVHDEENIDNETLDLNVSYSYAGASITGQIHSDISGLDNDEDNVTAPLTRGSSMFSGSVDSNLTGFVPFKINLMHQFTPDDQSVKSETVSMNIEYGEDINYSVSGRFFQTFTAQNGYWEDANQTIELSDSNGVVSQNMGYDINELYLHNINGKLLGTINLDNEHVEYEDDTVDSIF